MSIRSSVLKGSAILTGSQLVGYACSFLRNVLLARTLTKEDFGIAAALSLTVVAFEISSKLSIGTQIVQSSRGNDDDFLGSAHVCQFGAGLVGASLIAIFSGPMARFFGLPHLQWAFAAFSLLAVINGLSNLAFARAARQLDFTKRAIADVTPEVLLTAVAFPIILALPDYRAALILLALKAITAVVMTHVLSDRRYRWVFQRDHLLAILTFSLPIFGNGLLMFVYQQGDQMLIGNAFSVAVLAQYSLAISITVVPGHMFQYVVNTIALPVLSKNQRNSMLYSRYLGLCIECSTIAAVVIACGLILFGEYFVTAVFGAKYAGTGAIVGWLATANAIRIVRSIIAVASMARGDTMANLLSNIFRILGVGLAFIVIRLGRPVHEVAACAVVAELAALGFALIRLSAKTGVSVQRSGRAVVIGALLVSGVSAVGLLLAGSVSALTHLGASTLLIFGTLFAFWRSFPEVRDQVIRALSTLQARKAL